jgi:hypothetical protein
MQISPSKLAGFLTLIASISLVGAFGYFSYKSVFDGASAEVGTSIETVKGGAFGPKMQKAVKALSGGSGKISLKKKDLAFIEKDLFNSFTDIPDSVPLSDSRGRPNPFVPYVAP